MLYYIRRSRLNQDHLNRNNVRSRSQVNPTQHCIPVQVQRTNLGPTEAFNQNSNWFTAVHQSKEGSSGKGQGFVVV